VKPPRSLLKFELVGVVVNQWSALESSGPQVGRLGGDGGAGHTTEERRPLGILARNKMIATVFQVLDVRIRKNCSNSCENCSGQICGS